MKAKKLQLAFNSGSSVVVSQCQNCDSPKLTPIIFLGYLPPVNSFLKVGSVPKEEPSYPAQLLFCDKCKLVQLGCIVDPKVLFPSDYPYTSSTTKILRDNFKELSEECTKILSLNKKSLIIDIGSNDGNLLNNFKENHRVLGITPEKIGLLAVKNGIPTIIDYFRTKVVDEVLKKYGKADVITATNVFAHMEDIHGVLENIKRLLTKDGVFISESHYLAGLIKTVQYDTIYHEHLRYYSLHSISYLLEMHGLEVFYAKEIPPHGGSIRVYAARKGTRKVQLNVKEILRKEKKTVTNIKHFEEFKHKVLMSKLKLYKLLSGIKEKKQTIYGVGAPARGSTLINYVGLDGDIITRTLEAKGSYKIGKYIPGTLIPVLDEEINLKDQPDYVLLFSWHIAKELIPKLKQKGYKGKFIIPLPSPRIVS